MDAGPDSSPVVTAPAGTFRGSSADGVDAFKGIRYAQAPIGDRRWRDPVAAAAAPGETDATGFGPVAPQQVSPALNLGPDARQDEDCLFLNVWRPAAAESSVAAGAPVMVWLHGGAYTLGSSSQPIYDATRLVSAGEVIVVTVNYRIGALGFLDLSSFSTPEHTFDGNLALKDILLALRWVQRNIASFGGDPGRVTVFGESAGGGLVTTLLATPRADGLLHRAIAESSPATSVYGPERAREVAHLFLDEAGTTPEAVRDLLVDEVVAATMAVFAAVPAHSPGTLAFAPVVDGDLVPEAPASALHAGRGLPVPLVIGTNRDEASFFRFMKSPLMPVTKADIERMFADMHAQSPDVELPSRDAVLAGYEGVRHQLLGLGIARDIAFRLPTIWVAEGHAAVAPVWLYRFDHATRALDLIGLGATHGAELAYVWGNLDTGRRDPTFWLGGRRTAERISERMRARWTAFARGLPPDAEDAARWPAYEPGTRDTLVIDREDRVVADLDAPLRSGWGDAVLSFP